MSRARRSPLNRSISAGVAALLAAGAMAIGCSADDTVTSANPSVTFEADQDDIGQARFEQSEGRARWDAAALTDYTMAVGYSGLGMIEIEFTDDVMVSSTIVADGEEAEWLSDRGLPRNVAEAFEQLDTIIDATEASDTPPDGSCEARYFTARWDGELGYPTYYDALGPCEDGVGVTVVVTPSGDS